MYFSPSSLIWSIGLACAVTLAWPQLIFMLRNKKARMSVFSLCLILVMQTMFMAYAIMINTPVFVASNAVNLIPNIALLYMSIARR